MGLAETAQLLVKLTLKDETSGTAGKVKTSIADLGKTALLVGGAAGFAALTKGAMQAEAAQGKWMAATGKSREEAKAFVREMDSLAGSSGAVGRSFDEITATGTMVAQQFQITGEKSRLLTENILEFAKVTRQDATQAAGDLEDTLSAFGLSADDAAGFMDKLVASSQKYGTEAGPEVLGILRGMAPALQAMGMDLDDGVELLNAFEVAGLDAGSAQRGLQSAIANLKPGQNLDDLIAQIGAIEDPTLRAQKAIEIFGTRAGAGLAAVIKPGMTSLDEFGVSFQEAAGTVRRSSDNMLTTTQKIQGMFEKLGAGFRDVGQEFGPVVTGLSSVTLLMGPLTGKLREQVTELVAARGGWINFAKAVGPAGIALGIIGAEIAVANAASDGLEESYRNQADKARDLTSATTGEVAQLREFATAAYGAADNARLFGLIETDLSTSTRDLADAVSEAADRLENQLSVQSLIASERVDNAATVMGTATQSMATVVEHSTAAAGDSFTGLGEKLSGTLGEMAHDAHDGGVQIASNLSDALRNNKGFVADAMDDLVFAMNHPLKQAKALARIEGGLTGERLAEGLASMNPYIRTQAQQTRDTLIGQWESLSGRAYTEGTQATNQLGQGVIDHEDNVLGLARRLMQRLANILDQTYTVVVRGNFGGEHGYSGGGRAVGGEVAAGAMYRVNEGGPVEYFQPHSGGRIIPLAARGVSPVAQQLPPIVNVYITARDVEAATSHRRILQGSGAGFGGPAIR